MQIKNNLEACKLVSKYCLHLVISSLNNFSVACNTIQKDLQDAVVSIQNYFITQ